MPRRMRRLAPRWFCTTHVNATLERGRGAAGTPRSGRRGSARAGDAGPGPGFLPLGGMLTGGQDFPGLSVAAAGPETHPYLSRRRTGTHGPSSRHRPHRCAHRQLPGRASRRRAPHWLPGLQRKVLSVVRGTTVTPLPVTAGLRRIGHHLGGPGAQASPEVSAQVGSGGAGPVDPRFLSRHKGHRSDLPLHCLTSAQTKQQCPEGHFPRSSGEKRTGASSTAAMNFLRGRPAWSP